MIKFKLGDRVVMKKEWADSNPDIAEGYVGILIVSKESEWDSEYKVFNIYSPSLYLRAVDIYFKLADVIWLKQKKVK